MTSRKQKKAKTQKGAKSRRPLVRAVSKRGKDLGEVVLTAGHRAADASRETAHEVARAGKNFGLEIEQTGHDLQEVGVRQGHKISETLGKGIVKAGHVVETLGYDVEEELNKMEKKVDHKRDKKTA
jgi:hypothetical protein